MIRITKKMMEEALKDYFEEDYKEEMLGKFEDYLVVDIEQWIKDNVRAYSEYLREDKVI